MTWQPTQPDFSALEHADDVAAEAARRHRNLKRQLDTLAQRMDTLSVRMDTLMSRLHIVQELSFELADALAVDDDDRVHWVATKLARLTADDLSAVPAQAGAPACQVCGADLASDRPPLQAGQLLNKPSRERLLGEFHEAGLCWQHGVQANGGIQAIVKAEVGRQSNDTEVNHG